MLGRQTSTGSMQRGTSRPLSHDSQPSHQGTHSPTQEYVLSSSGVPQRKSKRSWFSKRFGSERRARKEGRKWGEQLAYDQVTECRCNFDESVSTNQRQNYTDNNRWYDRSCPGQVHEIDESTIQAIRHRYLGDSPNEPTSDSRSDRLRHIRSNAALEAYTEGVLNPDRMLSRLAGIILFEVVTVRDRPSRVD